MNTQALKIGILNVMHDKADTQRRYQQIFDKMSMPIEITFFYPKTHYRNRPVPDEVAAISEPLDLTQVKNFDAFIITGAPIENLPFNDIEYMDEIRCLINELNSNRIEQLYFCWGAMAAMHHYYGIEKHRLSEKIFGVFPNAIHHENELLTDLRHNFLAPHARYSEMNQDEIRQNSDLQIDSTTEDGKLFMVSDIEHPERQFLFSHMEYDKQALLKEYQREVASHPEREYKKPDNYFINKEKMTGPVFSWEDSQNVFFNNWIKKIIEANLAKAELVG